MELREQTRYLLVDPDQVEEKVETFNRDNKNADELSAGHFSAASSGEISDQVMDAT